MDDRLRLAYDNVYTTWVLGAPRSPRVSRVLQRDFGIGDAIESADEALPSGAKLRADSKAFLAVNFAELILTPLALGGRPLNAYLREDLQADIALLARSAEPSAPLEPHGSSEISAHSLIDSISRNWSNVRLASEGIWGPDE